MVDKQDALSLTCLKDRTIDLDTGLARPPYRIQQRFGLHEDAGGTEPALGGPRRHEAACPLLALLGGEPLLRHDAPPGRPRGRLGARHDRLPIHEDGARAARPFGRAPVLDGSQPARLPEQLQKAGPFSGSGGDRAAVEGEVHRRHRLSQPPPWPAAAM